jgi:plastocyanin
MSETVDERTEPAPEPEAPARPTGLPPVAIPLVSLVLMLVLVFSTSRMLLAVSKTSAVMIALFLSLNVLVGAALVSAGRWVRNRPAAFPLIVIAAALVVAGGAVALPFTEPPEEHLPAVTVVAEGVAFTTPQVTVPANEAFEIEFDNRDAATDHNIHIGENEQPPPASEPGLFTGALITGPASVAYEIEPLPPGVYGFLCDVHPTMTGTITAEEGAEPGASEGEPPPGESPSPGEPTPTEAPAGDADLTAENTAFDPSELTAQPEDGTVSFVFENLDSVQHNVAVTAGDDASDPPLFEGELVDGPGTVTYSFEAPDPGDYFFYCQVHPTQMTGTLTVE